MVRKVISGQSIEMQYLTYQQVTLTKACNAAHPSTHISDLVRGSIHIHSQRMSLVQDAGRIVHRIIWMSELPLRVTHQSQ